jgi:protein-disulfide isomerase
MPRFKALTAILALSCALLIGGASGYAADNNTLEAKSAFTPAQREEMKRMFHDYIFANPDVIKEAIIVLQAKDEASRDEQQKSAIASRQQELIDPAEATIIGNPRGNVTITEFFDYNCGYCKSLFPTLMEVVKEDGNIRVVMKELPILAPSSRTAAMAALASVKQGRYYEFHTVLISYKGKLTDQTIMDAAKTAGLDVDKLQADMKNPEVAKTVSRNIDLATVLQINGTPALIVGKNFVPGAIDKAKLKELVAAAREKPKKG